MTFSQLANTFLTDINLTLLILAVAIFLFMQGKVRSDMVALGSMMALMLVGIITPNEALQGFSSSVIVMMVGLFVVGAGIFRTGLAKIISSKILKLAGDNENKQFILIMLVTALVGSLVSNTGTVAVMMPIVISMAAAAGQNPRRYLMPMAFASGMGMFTLISTPPNLVIQEALINGGYEPLSFFSFAPIGAIAVLVGITILFFSSKLLKNKDTDDGGRAKEKSLKELVGEYNVSSRLYKLSVPAKSPMTHKTLSELRTTNKYGVRIVKIVRHGRKGLFKRHSMEETATKDSEIKAFDTLFCDGTAANIERFALENELTVEQVENSATVETLKRYGHAEIVILPNSRLINNTLEEARFGELHNVRVLAIKHRGESYSDDDLKDAKLHSGDSLLIHGTWENISHLTGLQNDLVIMGDLAHIESKATIDRKAPVAAIILIVMIIMMVLDVIPSVVTILSAAGLMVITGCLRNMEEAYSSINWSSIMLIGGMIPMAIAFEKTGITTIIADWLMNSFGDASPHMLLGAIYVSTSILTLFLSNTATAILFTPIALKLASAMDVSPYPFLFAVAVAATMCFASPFSTPPNALVMGPGNYKFMDYVKVGLPLQIIMAVVMIFVLPLIYHF